MRFKKPSEYPTTSQPTPELAAKIIPPEVPKPTVWECVVCSDRAVLLHKGTAYCRPCYQKRNYEGTLIN